MVVVGSPRVLLNTEQHMIKLYGDKGRCWSLYLKSCLEHDTLIIPQLVESDRSIARRFKEELAFHLGATLPNDQILQSSRPNYRTCPRDANMVTISNMYATNSSGSVTHSAQSRDSHHEAIHAKSGMRLVHKPLSSNENVLKQMSQVGSMAPINLLQTSTSTYSHPAIQKRSQWGSVHKSRAALVDEGANQPLNIKSAAKQILQESRIDFAGTTISNNKQTACSNLATSQSIKLESSTQLSESSLRQNVKINPKSESRGKI